MNEEKRRITIGFGGMLFLSLLVIIGVVAMLLFFTTSVPAGSVGIQDTFGSVSDDVMQPGFHLKFPFTAIYPMSTRTQKYIDYGTSDKATITALSNDGLTTTIIHERLDKAGGT